MILVGWWLLKFEYKSVQKFSKIVINGSIFIAKYVVEKLDKKLTLLEEEEKHKSNVEKNLELAVRKWSLAKKMHKGHISWRKKYEPEQKKSKLKVWHSF